MQPTELSLSRARTLLQSGELTPESLAVACFAAIETKNPALNAFSQVFDARSFYLQTSNAPLANLPIAIKDMLDVAGFPTAAGSPKFFGREPAQKDAFVVEKLKKAGALLIGKTNTHEIALGITGINPHTGPVRNPHDPSRITGGSSSGSAAAVAAGMVLGALGTDTGGSIRIPSALCGVVGFKPTFGRVSLRGVLPLSWNLDHVGPIAKTVEDAAILYQVIAGYDPRDPHSVAAGYGILRDLDALPTSRIALAVGEYIEEADPGVLAAVRQAAEVFRSLGHEVVEVEIPRLREAAQANSTMVIADAAAFHRERLAEHPDWFGADVRERLERGRAVTSTEYILARRVQTEMKRYFELFFEQYNFLLLPTTAAVAAPIEGLNSAAYAPKLTRFTAPFNLTGLPALTVPCGTVDGLPVGLQIVGKAWDESGVLRAGRAYERAIAAN
ncbi:MAG: Asp-tRNA(Asn)/Glu-tRNA(Gln) amidotransferase GatCAB subunit A [Anaerolineae bacterium]|nr:MAG: Asp-tRNA(Asn)/Glu-tRNA(Gln) amidotransferase GatCAB subunit A [Anaerolineae bacterium]